MKKATLITTLTLGALLIGGTAFAWNGGCNKNCDGPRGERGPGMMNAEQQQDRMERHHEFMKVALDLTEEQEQQLEALREKHQAERQAMRETMRASRDELRELAHSENFDEKAYRAKARAKADLQTEMQASRNQHKQEMLALLTPEQQEKAEKLWELHQEKRGKGNRDGRRGPHGECGQHKGPGFMMGGMQPDEE